MLAIHNLKTIQKQLRGPCLAMLMILILGANEVSYSQSLPNYLPKNGLVGWWPFNGNSNDHSGNVDHGLNNNVKLTEDRFGNCNQAYRFDSIDSYIKLDSFNFPAYTVSAWVNLFSIEGDTSMQHYVFSFGHRFDNIYLSTGKDISDIYLFSRYITGSSVYALGDGVSIPENKFFHVLSVFEDGKALLYLNGLAVDSTCRTCRFSTNVSNSTFKYIGNQSLGHLGQYASKFNGSIDDVGLWNRRLSPKEIQNLSRAGNAYKLIQSHPQEQNVDSLENAQFTVRSNQQDVTYQWQVFAIDQYIDLEENNQFKGVKTDTLTINRVNQSNHYSSFRCIVSANNCTKTSESARLILNQLIGLSENLDSRSNVLVKNNLASNEVSINVNPQLIGKELAVYSLNGTKLMQKQIQESKFVINISSLKSGIYFLKIEEVLESFKILKL